MEFLLNMECIKITSEDLDHLIWKYRLTWNLYKNSKTEHYILVQVPMYESLVTYRNHNNIYLPFNVYNIDSMTTVPVIIQ